MSCDIKCDKNFLELKKKLTSAPLLQYPDLKKPYQLKTEASDLAIGAVPKILTPQGYKLITHESKMLLMFKRNCSIHDKKLFAIVHTLKKQSCYLKEI